MATVTMADGTIRSITLQGVGCRSGMCSRVRARSTNADSMWLDVLFQFLQYLRVTRVVLSRLSSDSKMGRSATLPSSPAIGCSTCNGTWDSQKSWTSEACEELISSNLPIIPNEDVANVDCCGCLVVQRRGEEADITCND